jgi:hypothetical protein
VRFGFTVEAAFADRANDEFVWAVSAAFADRANDEFVWAVSAAGDQVAFAALEQEYNALPSRAKAFYGVPQRVDKVVVAFVTVHADQRDD